MINPLFLYSVPHALQSNNTFQCNRYCQRLKARSAPSVGNKVVFRSMRYSTCVYQVHMIDAMHVHAHVYHCVL